MDREETAVYVPKIRDMAENDRPRERLIQVGPGPSPQPNY